MVGPPKTLEDLRKVEGLVRITCRACGHVRTWNREELPIELRFRRQSSDWQLLRASMRCNRCESRDTQVDGVQFGENAAELRQRRSAMLVMNLALSILKAAAYPSGKPPMPIDAVRLALRVLHPFVASPELLTIYWTALTTEDRLVHEGPQHPFYAISARLVYNGHAVWAELRG